MALFFDREWFDAKLAERGLERRILASAAAISPAELELVYKDQREVSAQEVAIFAELLGVPASEVASRAGISTPAPGQNDLSARVGALERRLAALEAELLRLRGG